MPSQSKDRTWSEFFVDYLWAEYVNAPAKPLDPAALPKNLLLGSALLSEHAYLSLGDARKHPSLKDFLNDQVEGFPVFLTGNGGSDAQAFVWMTKSKREAIVAYRGTESWRDIFADVYIKMADFQVETDKHQSVLVHNGFLRQFRSLQEEVSTLLEKNKSKYDSIVSTGHSLGGALATLSAIHYAGKYPTKSHKCVTFGSPRVGEKELALVFNKLVPIHYRVVNQNDPVPMAPGGSRYFHVHDAITITDNLDVYTQADSHGLYARLKYIAANLDWSSKVTQDHGMALYNQRLKTILDRPSGGNP